MAPKIHSFTTTAAAAALTLLFPLTGSLKAAVLLADAADATYSLPRSNGATFDAGTSGTALVILQNGVTTDNVLQVGGTSANANIATAIIPFILPTLNPGESFSAASFSIGQSSASNAQQFDLYGLGARASAATSPLDYYRGTTGGDATDAILIQASFISTADSFAAQAVTSTSATGNTALTNYLNAQYALGANAGKTVFLRLNVTDTYTTNNSRLNPSAVESATAALRPFINYSVATVPEPAGLSLLGLVLGSALLRRRRA